MPKPRFTQKQKNLSQHRRDFSIMKKRIAISLLVILLMLSFCYIHKYKQKNRIADKAIEKTSNITAKERKDVTIKIQITINHHVFIATLENNAAAKAFKEKLANGPLTITMKDYSGFEKVGNLEWELPIDHQQITSVSGDILLYQENQIVLFYGSNSWKYTRLGKVDNLNGWETALGKKDVEVCFALD